MKLIVLGSGAGGGSPQWNCRCAVCALFWSGDPRVQRRTLTPAEVSRLLAACEERFAAAVALCYVQGWRVSEAL